MTPSDVSMTIAVVTERGEIALGLEHKDKQFVVEVLASGDILLRRNSTFKVDVLVGGEASIIRTFVDSVGKKTTSRAALRVPVAGNQLVHAEPSAC